MIRLATAATTTGFTISKEALSCKYWTIINGGHIQNPTEMPIRCSRHRVIMQVIYLLLGLHHDSANSRAGSCDLDGRESAPVGARERGEGHLC